MGERTSKELTLSVKALPTKTGVYLMKDARSKVIYVGKAVNLRSRALSYFRDSGDERPFVRLLRDKVRKVDFVLTDTEKEALILENNLIKQFRPRYNINLKDDKNFVCLKFDLSHPFPRLEIVRRFEKGHVLHFGPYSSARSARMTFRQINSFFPLRKCPDTVFRRRLRPCLNYQIGQCFAPCCGYVDERAYRELVNQAAMFLRGRNRELTQRLKKNMKEAAEGMDYERAAKLRDRIAAIEATIESQKITEARFIDRDVFGYASEDGHVQIDVMFVRNGRLQDFASYSFRRPKLLADEVFSSFLNQFYSTNRFVPDEVLVPRELEDMKVLTEWLSEMRGKKATVRCPKRGHGVRLVEMAMNNAELSLKAGMASAGPEVLSEALREGLDLSSPPRTVECFDVSNICGDYATGSCVRFRDGLPERTGYRRYRVKTVSGIDDYSMLEEVLTRRLSRGLKEKDLPNLAMIDGGKGHLSVAESVLRKLQLDGVELVAIAKGRDEKGAKRRGTEDRFFRPGVAEPIRLDPGSRAGRFLRRVRDEAHRFALSYHRKLRSSAYRHSELDGIRGLGEARKKALFLHFGNFEAIRKAGVHELASVKGISRNLAAAIRTRLDSE